jgi:hypothetical protein
VAQQLYAAVSERSEHLSKLAHTFSPEAMRSAANLSQAQLQSDMAVGQAMGPAQAGIDRAKQDAIAEETAGTLKNAEQIGAGMIVLNSIWNETKLQSMAAADAVLMALGSTVQDPNMAAGAGANQAETNPLVDALKSSTPVLGLISDLLESVYAKVKGD